MEQCKETNIGELPGRKVLEKSCLCGESKVICEKGSICNLNVCIAKECATQLQNWDKAQSSNHMSELKAYEWCRDDGKKCCRCLSATSRKNKAFCSLGELCRNGGSFGQDYCSRLLGGRITDDVRAHRVAKFLDEYSDYFSHNGVDSVCVNPMGMPKFTPKQCRTKDSQSFREADWECQMIHAKNMHTQSSSETLANADSICVSTLEREDGNIRKLLRLKKRGVGMRTCFSTSAGNSSVGCSKALLDFVKSGRSEPGESPCDPPADDAFSDETQQFAKMFVERGLQ